MGEPDDLGQVSPLHRGSKPDLSLAGLFSQQAADEGGLSRAVVAQQGNALTALHIQVHFGEQCSVPKPLCHILHREYRIAGKVLFPEVGLHGPLLLGLLGLFDALHPVLNGHGAAEQGAVVDAPALHPLQCKAQLLQLGLLLLVLLHLQVKSRLLFLNIERVVAGIEFSVSVHDLHNPVSHLIQEVTVVGDHQHRSPEGVDILLQPLHAAQIQVVGGLVQQQNVRFLQQQPGKIHPGFFTAGQAVEFLLPLRRGNAQTVADLVGLHIHVIAAAGLEPVAEGVILPEHLRGSAPGHLMFQQLHAAAQLHQRREGRAKHILHRVSRREFGNLGDQSQPLVGVDENRTVIVIHLTGKNLEQGGFSAAVASQNRDALALLHLEAQTLQQVFPDHEELR